MSKASPLAPLNSESRPDQIFPTLNSEQIARISAHGTKRQIEPGEVVYEPGTEDAPFLVVVAGQLQLVRSALCRILVGLRAVWPLTPRGS